MDESDFYYLVEEDSLILMKPRIQPRLYFLITLYKILFLKSNELLEYCTPVLLSN